MPQLQKPLQGLARFLGLQSQGSLSVNWTPDLVPTYDLSDWIGAPLTNQNRSTTVPQNGTFTAFTVPDGETWLMQWISTLIIPAAANNTDSYIRLVRSGVTQGLVLAPTDRPTNLGQMHRPAVESGYALYPRKLFLFGGDSIGVRLQSGGAGGNNEIRVGWGYVNLNV